MEQDFLEQYVDKRFFIQNPPQSEKEFGEWCKKIGLAKQEPVEPLLLSYDPGVVEEMLNKSFGNVMEMRTPLKNKVNKQELRSPLFASTELAHKSQQAKQYYSSFQFVLLDDQLARFSFSREELTKLLLFTIAIQNIYRPFFRADGKHIGFEGGDPDWHTRRKEYKLDEAFALSGVNIDRVAAWYKSLSDVARFYLGVGRTDHNWLQLWKNLSWKKKEALEGTVRRGVEYLQWALMIKVAIQDHVGHEILDIDEMSNIASEDVLKIETDRTDRRSMLLRDSRNHLFTDPETRINYYHDKYKRLNFLANSFSIEYQPKLILFVEGETEEMVLPKIFEWYRGKPGYFGVEIINLHGVDTFQSTHDEAVKLQRLLIEIESSERLVAIPKARKKSLNQVIRELKKVDIILSNWEAFINFNLEKWQALPFFLSDNEGRIPELLKTSKLIKFGNNRYDIPKKWKYVWGVSNDNKPLRGDSFELANFTNQEISYSIKQLYGDSVLEADIERLRTAGESLERVIEKLKAQKPRNRYRKTAIVEQLVENMFTKYERAAVPTLDKPIFAVIDQILQIAALNHAPTTAINAADNRIAIVEQITEE